MTIIPAKSKMLMYLIMAWSNLQLHIKNKQLNNRFDFINREQKTYFPESNEKMTVIRKRIEEIQLG